MPVAVTAAASVSELALSTGARLRVRGVIQQRVVVVGGGGGGCGGGGGVGGLEYQLAIQLVGFDSAQFKFIVNYYIFVVFNFIFLYILIFILMHNKLKCI